MVTGQLQKPKGLQQTLKPKLSQTQSLRALPKSNKRKKAQRTLKKEILVTVPDRDDGRREAAAGVVPEAEPGLDWGQGRGRL